MNEVLKIAEGSTEDVDFQLLVDGAVQDLTGATIELILNDYNGFVIDTSGDTSLVDGPTGKVRYSPDAADLVSTKSPYSARWKITKGGKVSFFPSNAPDIWEIQKP